MSGEVRRRSAFEAAIDEAPDDPTRYAVLGDWLDQQGELRGELIALMLCEHLEPARAQRVRALLDHESIRVRGPTVGWRWGYVRDATVSVPFTAWTHPSLRFLRELAFAAVSEPLEPRLAQLANARPPVLHTLTIVTPRPVELAAIATLPLAALHLSVPQLGGVLPRLPRLAHLELGGLIDRQRQAEAFFSMNSQLRSVTVQCIGAIIVEHLAGILSLPSLERLALRADETGEEVIDALLDSPAGRRLRTLDLSASGLTEPAALRLLARAPEHPALDELVLGSA